MITETHALSLLNLLNGYFNQVGKGYICILVPTEHVKPLRAYEELLVQTNNMSVTGSRCLFGDKHPSGQALKPCDDVNKPEMAGK